MINAKYLGLTANQLAETASKLEAENTKLRELVRGCLMDTVEYAESQGMPFDDTDMFALSKWQRADIERRARELEVIE